MAKNRKYHLWRKYAEAPFRAWACTIEKTGEGDGYKVVDFDPSVADTGFLHVEDDTVWFVHASYAPPMCVVKELASSSLILDESRYRVAGKLTADPDLLARWLSGTAIL